MLSTVEARNPGHPPEGLSHLADGTALRTRLEQAPALYLGERHIHRCGAQPGVLLKLIDATERLTVQVHPDRSDAQRLFHSPYGKTECWHILDDTPVDGEAPCVYLGFRPGITRDHWRELFDRQDVVGMLAALHKLPVHRGDTILIEGGVPHAIGAHCFLAEIQEPTDYTIRVERTTPAGLAVCDELCHQGLGFDAMFDCFHYEGLPLEEIRRRWFIKPKTLWHGPDGQADTLIGYDTTPMFQLDRFVVHRKLFVPALDCFSGLLVLAGQGTAWAAHSRCPLRRGDQVFLPAGLGNWEVTAGPDQPLEILRFMVNQIESHPYLTNQPLINYCQGQGITVEIWSPLGGGKANLLENQTILTLAQKYNRTPAQIVIRWHLQRGVVVMPKSVHQERIISNRQVFDFTLLDEDMDVIQKLNRDLRVGSDPDNFTF